MPVGAICTNARDALAALPICRVLRAGLSLDGAELIVYSDDFNNANPVATFTRQTSGAESLNSSMPTKQKARQSGGLFPFARFFCGGGFAPRSLDRTRVLDRFESSRAIL